MWLVALLTLGQAWALTVTMSPQGAGTYRVENGRLYVTANPGYYLLEARQGFSTMPLTEVADENGVVFFTVSDSWEVTISFGTCTNNVHVTFDMNGHGGTAPAAQDLTLGDKVACPSPDPTEEGFVFCGWTTDWSGWKPYDFDAVLTNSLPYSIPNKYYTLTLYAVWADTSKEYTLSYYDDIGSPIWRDMIMGGTAYTIRGDDIYNASDSLYRLVGWATKPGGSVVVVPEQQINVTKDLRFYAVKEMVNARYSLSPDAARLTDAGYTDITFSMGTLILGRVGYDDIGNPMKADGITLFMSNGTLHGEGYSIPFKVDDKEHAAPRDEVTFYDIVHPSDSFTLAVYIDPEDLKAAPPGYYCRSLSCTAFWEPMNVEAEHYGIFIDMELPKRGDVNGDGEVNVTDVTALVNIILGSTTDYDTAIADVNGDGEVNVTDVTALVNIILGQ